LGQVLPGRVLHRGWSEYFFDQTEVEVYGKKIEGARINYEGNLALSWQVLWKGPFILDQQLDGTSDVSEHLPAFLGSSGRFVFGVWRGPQAPRWLGACPTGPRKDLDPPWRPWVRFFAVSPGG
jgi:hypothetical protein